MAMQTPSAQRPSSCAWSPMEDEILMRARAQGLNWAPIQHTHFPSKTPNACRKRHERLMERRNAEDWDSIKLDTMAKEYMILRKEMWSILGNKVGEKWQIVESKCLEKGLKNLQSAARNALRKERLMSGTSTDDSGIADTDDTEIEPGGEDELRGMRKRPSEEAESEQKRSRIDMVVPSIASILQTPG
ncbi:MAG: hypothetical protein M1819_004859 [Sarea resinae]|nr:MAG: hypothetical protein M1819_004859 [Sarea resinae]